MVWFPDFKDITFNVFFIVFCSFAGLQLLYVLLIHSRLAFYKKRETTAQYLPPVTVIIAARNESDNLYENLPLILEQDYPNFEVIVVNNQSIDDSSWLLTAFSRQFPNLKVVELGKNKHLRPGKKLPITLGIKAAKYEHFVLTDADCKPTSNKWLFHMASRFSNEKQIVMGYGPFHKTKGFVNRLIRFDAAWIGVSYFSMALSRLPYMAVGRNMAYTKNVFNAVQGFRSHYSLPSGDDDLFIQEAAQNNNYTIQIEPESFCFSPAAPNWKRWMLQKSRHYSTSTKYRFIKKALLGIYPITLLMMWISFIPLFWKVSYIPLSAGILLFVIIIKWWIQGRCLYKLNERSFVRFLPFWDVFYAIVIPILYYVSERQNRSRW